MKANRFKLTALFAVALLAAGVGLGAAAQHLQEEGPGPASDAPTHTGDDLGLDLELLLDNITDRWQQQDQLTAQVRWQVQLFGSTISGAGEYTQAGRGSAQRHGLLLTADDPQFPMTLQQAVLSREPILWTQWRSSLEQSATMIRLADVAAASRKHSAGREMPTAGLAHLIWRLRQAYDFQTARHVVYGQRQLLLVQGVARTDASAEVNVLPFLDRRAEGASILLDATTGFPHRIQWEAIEEKPDATPSHNSGKRSSGKRSPIVTVDLFQVRLEDSANADLLQPKTVVPDATDETSAYRTAVLGREPQEAASERF